MGILYIISTPIGNLQDISLRAIETLQRVNFIACEDTRKTGLLLKFLQTLQNRIRSDDKKQIFKRPTLISYYEQNEIQKIPKIINLLKNDCDVALVTDAGTPAISDPGFKLIRECIREKIKVESIPGPSSVISALVVSGLPTDKFLFLGFLPRKKRHRKKSLENTKESLKFIKATVILFESPYRLFDTLGELMEIFGDIDIVIARELTKIHEEVKRNKISSFSTFYEKTKPRGEYVVLFNFVPGRTE